MNTGKIYLIPTPIAEDSLENSILPFNIEIIKGLDFFVVENIRTTRRFFSSVGIKNIEDIRFELLDKRSGNEAARNYIDLILSGKNAGVLSEAGCPGIADPGSILVKLAHEKNIEVIPLVGPSSIFLALMGSGFNGQNFVFHGYFPIDKNERRKKILEIEKNAGKYHQTQIFMETPYRNNTMFSDLLNLLKPETKLCIASNLYDKSHFLKTQAIKFWKKTEINLHKKPTIFLVYV